MDEFNRTRERTEERTCELEGRTNRNYDLNNIENRLGKKDQSLRDLWGYNKRSNICVMRVVEGKKK